MIGNVEYVNKPRYVKNILQINLPNEETLNITHYPSIILENGLTLRIQDCACIFYTQI